MNIYVSNSYFNPHFRTKYNISCISSSVLALYHDFLQTTGPNFGFQLGTLQYTEAN